MPEWTRYVRPHLAGLRLDPGREAEIVDEVSQHLDQRYEDTTLEAWFDQAGSQHQIFNYANYLGVKLPLAKAVQPLEVAAL